MMCINIYTNCTPKARNEEEEVSQHENVRREVMNTRRNEKSYLMVIAIIRNSVNVNVKKMSRRITLPNTKSRTYIVVLLKHSITHWIFYLVRPGQILNTKEKY